MSTLLSLLAAASPGLANGQSTHIWITQHALEHLPDGELKELLTDPALEPMLINGAMFPDGGYPLDDPYAEIAHWEPFQDRYRDWIAAHYSPPYTDEGAQHVAFLMGMASHGMADQVFDALYYPRGQQHDPDSDFGGFESFDTATDVVWMSIAGPVELPEDQVPTDTLVQLYAEHGHEVSADTLATGQSLLRIAVEWVGNMAALPEQVDYYAGLFPWMNSHLDDPTVSGNPPCEGEVVAAYWQSVWARLHGDLALDPEIIAIFPRSGYGLDTDHTRVESRISVAFAQAIVQESLPDPPVVVTDEDGNAVAVDTWLYYGDNSHVLHIQPVDDWRPDTTYTVHIVDGIRTIDGQQTTGDTRFTVSTAAPPDDGSTAGGDTGGGRAEDDRGAAGGCAGSSGSAGLLVVLPWALAGRSRRDPSPAPGRWRRRWRW
ncbi:MAG: hypothetical protein D6798_14845 [Deltaproteobacteria bacterium]|nr:MAG: hypothetical protein D6798_14845 [Deltaproteobacteria bacterium]